MRGCRNQSSILNLEMPLSHLHQGSEVQENARYEITGLIQVIVPCPAGVRYHGSSFDYSSMRDLKVGWESDYVLSSRRVYWLSVNPEHSATAPYTNTTRGSRTATVLLLVYSQ